MFVRMCTDASAPHSRIFFKKYVPVVWRRLSRIWPSLAAAVFFVGYIWPAHIDTHSDVIGTTFEGKCDKMWWPVSTPAQSFGVPHVPTLGKILAW